MANPSPTAQRPANQDATSSAKPTASFRFGLISAAIFTNQVKLASGKTANVANVTLRRSYRDDQGAWQHTHSLRASDLLPAALALTKCYESIADANGNDDERE
jgi:hypothetical protein